MKVRVVPMTQRLQKALAAFRRLRGGRVLYADGGSSVTAKVLQNGWPRLSDGQIAEALLLDSTGRERADEENRTSKRDRAWPPLQPALWQRQKLT